MSAIRRVFGLRLLMLCTPCLYLHPAAQLFQDAHVVVYRSDCRYLPYSIHFSEFMAIFDRRKRKKDESTRSQYENGRRRLLGAQSINTKRVDEVKFMLISRNFLENYSSPSFFS